MRSVLCILVSEEKSLPSQLARCGPESEKHRIELVDLTVPEPDYEKLLDKIFAADSVQVW